MLLSTPCHTDTWAYLNQSLLISLITTFRGRACEFQQFHSILTPIIINTLNTLTAIMTVACLVDAHKFYTYYTVSPIKITRAFIQTRISDKVELKRNLRQNLKA